MKRFAVVLGGALAAAALAVAPALASSQVGVPNYNPAGDHQDVAMTVQTIATPTLSSLGYTATNPGAVTNIFAPKQAVTFRMWAVETGTGKVLTDQDVRQAFVVIPNQPKLMLKWGKLSTKAGAPSFWVGTWTIPADYKLGTIGIKAYLRTKTGYKLGVFTDETLAAGSQLQVVATP